MRRRGRREGEVTMSSNMKKACNLIWIAASVLLSGCPGLNRYPPPGTPANRDAFKRAQERLRSELMPQNGDSGITFDANTIVIGVVPNPDTNARPNLTRIPSEMHVREKTQRELSWMCWDGVFTLTFKPASPTQESPLVGKQTVIQGSRTVPSAAKATVRDDVTRGRYNFTITVTLPDGTEVKDLDCPPIIID